MTLQPIKKHNFDEVYDSQKVYRLILEAMCDPGKAVSIQEYADKLYGEYPGIFSVALTLLDNEVSFHVCGDDSLSEEIASLTYSKRERIEDADYIFVCDLGYMEHVIENAKSGTLADPHKGATVIIQNDGAPSRRLSLSGPGIDGQAGILLTQAAKGAIAIRDALDHEYPQGIDVLLVSGTGALLAIPRLIKVVE